MKEYQFKLSASSKKYICPQCGENSFTYYLDIEAHEECGWCDRQVKCGYHKYPKRSIDDENYSVDHFHFKHIKREAPPVLIPDKLMQTLSQQEQILENSFYQNLIKKGIPSALAMSAFNLYKLGVHARRVAFPYIDKSGGVRAVQLIEYDENNHRKKDSTTWLHSILNKDSPHHKNWLPDYLKQEKKVTALFGEHLINAFPNNPIHVVEAPKTAIIAAVYYGLPDNDLAPIWIAVGALNWLSDETVSMLARLKNNSRQVTLIPDLGAYENWKKKAQGLLFVSDILEKSASDEDKKNGLDLADYLWLDPWSNYLQIKKTEPLPSETLEDLAATECTKKAETDTEPSNDQSFSEAQKTKLKTRLNTLRDVDCYLLIDGKEDRTYLMPDDQKWINKILQSVPHMKRGAILKEHERIFFDIYNREDIPKIKRGCDATRAANLWLLNLSEQ